MKWQNGLEGINSRKLLSGYLYLNQISMLKYMFIY
jgi:hypothetical protein